MNLCAKSMQCSATAFGSSELSDAQLRVIPCFFEPNLKSPVPKPIHGPSPSDKGADLKQIVDPKQEQFRKAFEVAEIDLEHNETVTTLQADLSDIIRKICVLEREQADLTKRVDSLDRSSIV